VRLKREERGASAVEFAIIVSVLLLILFGIIQFGIAYNRVQGLESAGREGARTASIGAQVSDVVPRVRAAQSLFTSTDVLVDISWSADNGTSYTSICTNCAASSTTRPCQTAGAGHLVRVTARVPAAAKYAIAIPLWSNWQITYTGTGVFRCEKTGA
jgi:Flp pilus assembly protein TadG